jgi:lipoprotein NlpI
MDAKQIVALFNRGTIKAKQGNAAAARTDFEAVLAVAPDHAQAKQSLAALSKAGG